MTCACGKGTVWFDHDKGRWVASADHKEPCARPRPRTVGA